MGFLYKTAFWLGLVYYAMPWGRMPELETRPAAAALCGPAGLAVGQKLAALAPDYRAIAALGCAAVAATPARPPAPSAQTLNDSDRTPPWRDPARPPPPPLPPMRPRTT